MPIFFRKIRLIAEKNSDSKFFELISFSVVFAVTLFINSPVFAQQERVSIDSETVSPVEVIADKPGSGLVNSEKSESNELASSKPEEPNKAIAHKTVLARPDYGTASNTIKNFSIVHGGILRGSAPGTQGIECLAKSGVKTIVDLRMPGPASIIERKQAESLGMDYVHIPFGFRSPSKDKVRLVLAIMNDSAKQPVFLHCRQGADRTGMLVGMYRMLYENWSFDSAYEEMREHHFKPWLLGMKANVRDCSEDSDLIDDVRIAEDGKRPGVKIGSNELEPSQL